MVRRAGPPTTMVLMEVAGGGQLFDGAPVPRDGKIEPALSRPGIGVALKRQDADQFLDH